MGERNLFGGGGGLLLRRGRRRDLLSPTLYWESCLETLVVRLRGVLLLSSVHVGNSCGQWVETRLTLMMVRVRVARGEDLRL